MGGPEAAGQERVNVRGGQRRAFRNRSVWFLQALSEGPLGEHHERQRRRSGIRSCERTAGAAPGRAASGSGTAAKRGRLCPPAGQRATTPRRCGVTEWGVTSPASSEGRDVTSAWQRTRSLLVICPLGVRLSVFLLWGFGSCQAPQRSVCWF